MLKTAGGPGDASLPRRLRAFLFSASLCGLLASVPVSSASAHQDGAASKSGASEVDTEHIFGFSEGSDIGEKGEKEIEIETEFGFGKRAGSYFASSTGVFYKYSISDDLRIAPGFFLAGHSIDGVPDLADKGRFDFEGLGVEIRYRVLDRDKAGVGLTISYEPGCGSTISAPSP